MSDFCNSCPSRNTCQSICPELEMHLKELEVPQRELPIGTPRYGKIPTPKIRIKLTKREQQILTLLAAGKTNREIGEVLNITQENVRYIKHNLSQKLPK